MKARFVLLLLISVAVTACSDRAEEQVQPVPQLSKEDAEGTGGHCKQQGCPLDPSSKV